MYTVYVLRSLKDKNLYIGCTGNIDSRVKIHNTGGVHSTKNRRPLEILYKEDYEDKYQAFRTEKFYKTAKGKKELLAKLNCPIV
jgi:putative endonuclease